MSPDNIGLTNTCSVIVSVYVAKVLITVGERTDRKARKEIP